MTAPKQRFREPATWLAFSFLGFAVSAAAQDSVQYPAFSPDIHLPRTTQLVSDEQAATIQGASLGGVSFGGLPAAQDVDGLHGLPNGDVLFSLETSMVLGGTLFRPNDVIRFDGSAWNMELDGSAEGIPDGVNIDAVAMDGNTLLISIDVTATLDGVVMSDSDVIGFNSGSFSLFQAAADAGIDPAADVDALHVDETSRLLMSFKTGGLLGGVDYRDEDVLAWSSTGSTWAMEYDGSADTDAWIPADLDAWSSIEVLNRIFRDGFEPTTVPMAP